MAAAERQQKLPTRPRIQDLETLIYNLWRENPMRMRRIRRDLEWMRRQGMKHGIEIWPSTHLN